MTLFGLFKSETARQEELKTKVRQGEVRITKFVQQLGKHAEDYFRLARSAHELDDQDQFKQLAAGYLQCREAINRWERYLVKMRALHMRRNEVQATREFLNSISLLTGSILQGVSPEEVEKVREEMEQANAQYEELEDTLATAMEDVVTRIGDSKRLDEGLLAQISHNSQPVNEHTPTQGKQLSEKDRRFLTAMNEVKLPEAGCRRSS